MSITTPTAPGNAAAAAAAAPAPAPCLDFAQSLTLVKNLLRVAVSTVAWKRQLFPEAAFRQAQMGEITYMRLVPQATEGGPAGQRVIQWLESGGACAVSRCRPAPAHPPPPAVFDALERKYLRKLTFAITENAAPEAGAAAYEAYTFSVAYPDPAAAGGGGGGITVNGDPVTSRRELKHAARNMVRSLISLAQTLGAPPLSRALAMKLEYYDAATPPDYGAWRFFCCVVPAPLTPPPSEPPFFHAGQSDAFSTFTGPPAARAELGAVPAPYHKLMLRFDGPEEAAVDGGDEDAAAAVPAVAVAVAVAAAAAEADDDETQLEDGQRTGWSNVILAHLHAADGLRLTALEIAADLQLNVRVPSPSSLFFASRPLTPASDDSRRPASTSSAASWARPTRPCAPTGASSGTTPAPPRPRRRRGEPRPTAKPRRRRWRRRPRRRSGCGSWEIWCVCLLLATRLAHPQPFPAQDFAGSQESQSQDQDPYFTNMRVTSNVSMIREPMFSPQQVRAIRRRV